MANVSGNLTPRLRRLERALASGAAGHEHEWAERVSHGLEGLFASLRRHAAEAEAPDGPMTEVDQNRPTLARQVAELRREHTVLLDRLLDLCRRVQSARKAFEPQTPGNGLPRPSPISATFDNGPTSWWPVFAVTNRAKPISSWKALPPTLAWATENRFPTSPRKRGVARTPRFTQGWSTGFQNEHLDR